jgi:undecaprenyl-diphosphatase
MEDLNHAIFLLLNTPEHPSRLLAIATFFAEYAIWVIPATIGIGWPFVKCACICPPPTALP